MIEWATSSCEQVASMDGFSFTYFQDENQKIPNPTKFSSCNQQEYFDAHRALTFQPGQHEERNAMQHSPKIARALCILTTDTGLGSYIEYTHSSL